MKISTYNVNSVNARLDNLETWLKNENPDIVLLQEIKCEYDGFPFSQLEALGYEVKILDEKSYNGVAILSRHKIKITMENLPDFADNHARYLEAEITVEGEDWMIASIYLPNGNPPYNNPQDTGKLEYKLRWMDALYHHAKSLRDSGKRVILGGDFNTILTNKDVYDPEAFRDNALFHPDVVAKLKAIEYLGFYDAFRLMYPDKIGYTYWDYTGAAFQSDLGLRIDYLLLSPKAADRMISVDIDKNPRRADKPSDHTPLTAEFK